MSSLPSWSDALTPDSFDNHGADISQGNRGATPSRSRSTTNDECYGAAQLSA
jgi:hypothetical protein